MNSNDNDNHTFKYFKRGLYAGLASMTSIITYPLEVLKIRYQVLENKQLTRHVIQTMFKVEGIKCFYKGLSQNLLQGFFGYGTVFFFYELLYNKLNLYSNHQLINSITSSALSGIIAVTLTSPFNYMKTRQILFKTVNENSLPTIFLLKNIYKENKSVFGFWKALNPSLITSFYSSIQITCYQLLKNIFIEGRFEKNEEQKLKLSSLFGLISRVVACSLIYPFTLLRSRILNYSRENQNISESNIKGEAFYISKDKYKRVVKDMYRIIKREGYSSLFRGIKFELIKVAINGAIFFYLYEYLLRKFD